MRSLTVAARTEQTLKPLWLYLNNARAWNYIDCKAEGKYKIIQTLVFRFIESGLIFMASSKAGGALFRLRTKDELTHPLGGDN